MYELAAFFSVQCSVFSLIQYIRHVCVFLCSPVSLQLSPALSEGRPQPGVPRGVVAHSSGSRNHDAFCRGGRDREEVGGRVMEGKMGNSHQVRQQGVIIWTTSGRSRMSERWSLSYACRCLIVHLTCSDRLEQDPVKSSMSDLEPPSRSSRMRSVGILPFRQVM